MYCTGLFAFKRHMYIKLCHVTFNNPWDEEAYLVLGAGTSHLLSGEGRTDGGGR